NEPEKVHRTAYQAFLAALVLWGLVLAPLGWILAPSLLGVVNAAPAVQIEALPFLRIMFVGSIGMLLFFMVGGALRAAGDARTPLHLGILLTALNIACNVAFITGLGPLPRLGTAGAAVGTTVAGLTMRGVDVGRADGRRGDRRGPESRRAPPRARRAGRARRLEPRPRARGGHRCAVPHHPAVAAGAIRHDRPGRRRPRRAAAALSQCVGTVRHRRPVLFRRSPGHRRYPLAALHLHRLADRRPAGVLQHAPGDAGSPPRGHLDGDP